MCTGRQFIFHHNHQGKNLCVKHKANIPNVSHTLYVSQCGELKNTIFIFNTKKYQVFAPMGRFKLESIYLYFPPSSQLVYLCFCPVGISLL